jgi:hypothetical protein
MKPSRELTKDFMKSIDPTARYWPVDMSLDFILDLVTYWSKDGLVLQHLPSKKWRVFIGFHPINIGENDHGDLPTAIMKAVVAAAKSGGAK